MFHPQTDPLVLLFLGNLNRLMLIHFTGDVAGALANALISRDAQITITNRKTAAVSRDTVFSYRSPEYA